MIWAIVATALGAITVLFVLALITGARMVDESDSVVLDDDPADEMSPEMRVRFDAWVRHVDDAINLANSDDCVMCVFDRDRRKDTTP